MPNWLTTRCKVSGSKEDFASFMKIVFTEVNGNKHFSFNRIVSMPDAILESVERASSNKAFYDGKAMALAIIALNDTHGIVKTSECPSAPNSGNNGRAKFNDGLLAYLLGGEKPSLSPLTEFREEVAMFLAGVDKNTGISSHPLSREATMAALQTIAPDFLKGGLSNYVKRFSRMELAGKALWSEEEASSEGPASLERLARKIMQSPASKDVLDSGMFQLRVFAETGYESWYDWSIVEWNTKWGADNIGISDESDSHIDFTFDAAWSFPEPIFKKLGEMFPQMKIWCACIEEDCEVSGWGYFTKVRGDEPGEGFDYNGDLDKAYFLVFGEERPEYDEEEQEDDEEGFENEEEEPEDKEKGPKHQTLQ